MEVLERIKQQVETHPVIIYMKGTPQLPQCGFSSRTAEALKSLGKQDRRGPQIAGH
jgi:monothiol glutaredoxin